MPASGGHDETVKVGAGNPAAKQLPKKDNLDPAYLQWAVESRARNQFSALKLFKLFDDNPSGFTGRERNQIAQALVGTCFSLWRAVFLADKTGLREAAFVDAKAFVGKLLTDNTINYSQDRNAREWTFNYYMNSANDNLLRLSAYWPNITDVLSSYKQSTKGTTSAQRRWNRHQHALEKALVWLEGVLSVEVEHSKRRKLLKKLSKGFDG